MTGVERAVDIGRYTGVWQTDGRTVRTDISRRQPHIPPLCISRCGRMLTGVLSIVANVSAEPTSLQLYVDGRLVDKNDSVISYYNLTQVNITCLVTGGHPEPIVSMRTTSGERQLTDVHALCTSQLTCSATASIQQYLIDHSTANRAVMCEARSRGSTHLQLSDSFTPHLAAGTCSPVTINEFLMTDIVSSHKRPCP